MIPKTIHYCWFGRNLLPPLAEKCIASWKKYCPDYEIIRWDEDNYDISAAPLYVRQAFELGKWAFITDYVRLQVVYENGGVYLDTDVELRKPLDKLLSNEAFFGLESGKNVATGLGFGAVKGAWILDEIMDDYRSIPLILQDGSIDNTPCPTRDTAIFLRHGLVLEDREQLLEGTVRIYPGEVLCPIDYDTGKLKVTRKTVSIHHYSASWLSEEGRAAEERRQKMERDRRKRIKLRQSVVKVVGEKNLDAVKKLLKK